MVVSDAGAMVLDAEVMICDAEAMVLDTETVLDAGVMIAQAVTVLDAEMMVLDAEATVLDTDRENGDERNLERGVRALVWKDVGRRDGAVVIGLVSDVPAVVDNVDIEGGRDDDVSSVSLGLADEARRDAGSRAGES